MDVNTNRKVRNEFIRKGDTFDMTSVPNGTYLLQWITGELWSPNVKIRECSGGFQKNMRVAESGENDWMKVSGDMKWTITLYSVMDGNMEQKSIGIDDLF